MTAMKKTLLEIVQNILSAMDSEDVNSISDSVEAEQVASIVEDTFYNIIATSNIPEHEELLKLTALSDSAYPTHFSYPSNLKHINCLWYKDDEGNYYEVKYEEPLNFITRVDGRQEDYQEVTDKNGGTTLRIGNTKNPSVFTSFDDKYIVLDSFKTTTESTLQESKIRCYGSKYPVFERTDSHVPDLDANYFPYFMNEAKSMCMSLLKSGSDPKVEQAARRARNNMLGNKKHLPDTARSKRVNYGR